ncbi:MAG: hypothetical protein LBP37_06370, partial [Spirochaetaceae bacterium]|nr:hypothetical protein [Spirochaetaceae bacterium]
LQRFGIKPDGIINFLAERASAPTNTTLKIPHGLPCGGSFADAANCMDDSALPPALTFDSGEGFDGHKGYRKNWGVSGKCGCVVGAICARGAQAVMS